MLKVKLNNKLKVKAEREKQMILYMYIAKELVLMGYLV